MVCILYIVLGVECLIKLLLTRLGLFSFNIFRVHPFTLRVRSNNGDRVTSCPRKLYPLPRNWLKRGYVLSKFAYGITDPEPLSRIFIIFVDIGGKVGVCDRTGSGMIHRDSKTYSYSSHAKWVQPTKPDNI